jgi:capsular polysaccharide biosynthesis protein
MRLTTPERLQLSRADLEPVLRLALIPLVAAVIGVACGLVYSLAQSTLYESRSQVVVSPASGFLDPSQADSFAAISTAVQELALTQHVLADAVGRLGKAGVEGRTTDWLRGRLRLSISGDTPLLTIAAVDGSQSVASAISKAETGALVNTINNVSTADGLRLQVFSEGEARGKVQPETWRNVLLGASAGLIIGCFVLAQLLSRGYRRRSA